LQFLERKATVSINGLINGGHITSGESRQLMMRYLSENHINHILDLLTNRFNEVIVDESQDCGESEIALLREIKARGILVTMIGDLDQSIYEFRDATPTQFREFVSNSGFATTARLNINHRSTAHIVSVVSSLRTGRTQDSASAKNLALQTNPIYLLSYTNLDQILPTINSGRRGNLDLQSCIVLSHTGEDARICAGASNSGRVGNGRTIRLAFNSMILASQQSSSKDKLTAISTIERLLLGLVDGLDTASKSTDKIVDEFKLSRRWLRSAALFVALSTSPLANTRESYTVQLQAKINKLTWQEGIVLKSVTSYLRRPTEAQWSTLNIPSTVSEHVSLPFNTVHGVKGQEFEGVILIIPRNLHPDSSGMTVLDYWENDADSEAKRVLYVGASRAIKTLLLAIHGNHISRIINILSQTNVTFEVL
jgi:superfamily I DNA/RNA helicase